MGRVGRRIGALALDWAIAYAASALFFTADGVVNGFAVSGIFVVLQIVFIPTIGAAGSDCGVPSFGLCCSGWLSPRWSGTRTNAVSTTRSPERCSSAARPTVAVGDQS